MLVNTRRPSFARACSGWKTTTGVRQAEARALSLKEPMGTTRRVCEIVLPCEVELTESVQGGIRQGRRDTFGRIGDQNADCQWLSLVSRKQFGAPVVAATGRSQCNFPPAADNPDHKSSRSRSNRCERSLEPREPCTNGHFSCNLVRSPSPGPKT